jgi:CheY-like chemotaxis protein
MEPLILIVDDDAAVRSLSVDILEDSGYPVLEAANASAALILLEEHPCVSLLFTDINMPLVNGYVLADMAVMRWPHLRVLYTTGEPTSPAAGKPAGLLSRGAAHRRRRRELGGRMESGARYRRRAGVLAQSAAKAGAAIGVLFADRHAPRRVGYADSSPQAKF